MKSTLRPFILLFCAVIFSLTTACTLSIHTPFAANANAPASPPTQLAFQTQPSSTAGAGVTFSSQPVIEIEDAKGNIVTSATNTVTLAAYTNSTCTTPASGTFTITNNGLAASSGVASFAGVNYGVTLTGPSTTIYIGASSSGLTSACSNAITITPGNPSKLIFSTEPSASGTAGIALSTQPGITIEDTYGNVVTSASNAVTLAAYTDSACTSAGTGTFSATTNPLTPTSGVATFAGVNYTKSGTFYIGASASGLSGACSSAINVAAGAPSQLVWTSAPYGNPFVNQCTPVQIGVEDKYGNTATVSGSAVNLTLVPSGSAKFYSDSACSTQTTTSTISAGSSSTPNIYLTDSVSESEGDYATAATLTPTPTDSSIWIVNAVVTAYSSTSFAAGTCQQVTVTFEDNNGATTAIGGGTNSGDLAGITAGSSQFYTDAACTTPLTSPMWFSSGATSATLYTKDIRAESFDPYITWGQTSGYLGVNSPPSGTQLGTTVTVNATTPQTLIITGPTFEAPGTCVPLTVTDTDQYGNPSPVSGSAMTVNLSATGSAAPNSSSSCTGPPISSVSIGVGSSSQTFYVEDSATETSTITASATSMTSASFNLDSTSTSLLTDVSTAGNFTCAVVGGAVKCWGNNDGGNLGNGTTTSSLAPVTVSGVSGVTKVLTGEGNSTSNDWACALESNNTVWCWGDTGGGGTSTPSEVKLSGSPILASSISMTAGDACATSTSYALYCWGYDFGNTLYTGTPQTIIGIGSGVSSVGDDDVKCVILTGGDLNCWGGNSQGQVGNGTTTYESSPVQVIGLTSGIVSVQQSNNLGYTTTCALNTSGSVYCWGFANDNRVADNSYSGNQTTPVASNESPLTSGVFAIYGIYNVSAFCAISSTGALYCWGGEMGGGNGIGGYNWSNDVLTEFSSGVTDFSGGYVQSDIYTQCAIVSGNLECWGHNYAGNLGNGTITDNTTPIYPMSLE